MEGTDAGMDGGDAQLEGGASPGIEITGGSLVVTEMGGTDSFAVALTARPTADVTVSIASDDESEGRVQPSSLTFTPDNWNAPQTIEVTGVDDEIADGDVVFVVRVGPASSDDDAFDGLASQELSVTNRDDDSAGMLVDAEEDLSTTEEGGQVTFTVALMSAPTANVVVPVVSQDDTEGAASPAQLTFTPDNWNAPQQVVVSGLDDELADGAVVYAVSVGPASSDDEAYQDLGAQEVSITNVDDDTAGVTVAPGDSSETSEGGGQADFTVRLNAQPSSVVVVGIRVTPDSEATADTTSVVFTPDNWNAPQTVTITGLDDDIQDGDQPVTVELSVGQTTDEAYAGLDLEDVSLVNTDDDTAGFSVSPVEGLTTTEAGGTDEVSIMLTSQPTADVVVSVASAAPDEASVAVSSLTFTPENWDAPQSFVVTGEDDLSADGDQSFVINLGLQSSDDANYAALDPADVSGSNTDDEQAGITPIVPEGGLVTGEDGSKDTLQLVLTSLPTSSVTVGVSVEPATEAIAETNEVVFTPENWDAPQTVTLAGQDDDVQDGSQLFRVSVSVTATDDTGYESLTLEDVIGTNLDDDTAGVRPELTGNGQTTESGGQAEFTVVLRSEPTANVTIPLLSGDLDEGTVSPSSLTFTPLNWNAPQTVAVTGVDDDVADGNQVYSVLIQPATSDDDNYQGLDPADVSLTNVDNDSAGVTIEADSPVVTRESGEQGSFTVVLNSQPTAGVTLLLSSGDTSEGQLEADSSTLVFTVDNWNAPQTVTVSGVDDDVADGDQLFDIDIDDVVSGDAAYDTLAVPSVPFRNEDNDSPGILVSPVEGLETTEAGGTAEFSVVLVSQPSADVVIPLESSDTTEGTLTVSELEFTPANWDAPQFVTVRGVDDDVQDGAQPYSIVLGLASSDDDLYDIDPSDVALSNRDNDSAGVTVSPTEGLETDEFGGTAQFSVTLDSRPTASVTIDVRSSDTDEGVVNKASLTFTPDNWNAPQVVTVTGVGDSVFDGNQPYTIALDPALSDDSAYAGLDPDDVSVTNLDNDPGVRVTPTAGLTVQETGSTATFTVVLNTAPASNVTISLSSGDLSEGVVAPSSLTFTPDNWNAPQTVTITGVDDDVADGNQTFQVVTSATASTDASYDKLPVADVSVSNRDDETAGINVQPTSGLVTDEEGGTATFTIVLDSEPTDDVTIGLSSSDGTEGSVSPSSVTFTPQNWNAARTITVTGLNDDVADGDQVFSVVTEPAVSDDPNYGGLGAADVSVTNEDDETAGVIVAPLSLVSREDGSANPTFGVRLRSQPTADVEVTLSSSDPGEGDVSPQVLTFTEDNWNAPQTATVSGVDDDLADGDQPYTIQVNPATSADATYDGQDGDDVAVLNIDDDSAGVTVTPPVLAETSEAGATATFSIVLNSQPTADVTIGLSSDDLSEGTVSPVEVTFTAENWNSPRTITVTGENDDVADGDQSYSVITTAAESVDPGYSGLVVANVALTNLDDETAGFEVVPTTGLEVSEAGTIDTFTVRLRSEPTANVTVELSSSDLSEVTVSPTFFVFTPQNWNAFQTATVTGQDDFVIDGEQVATILTSAASSTDPGYDALDPADVTVSNVDNESAGVRLEPAGGLETTEEGGQAVFGIALTSQPTDDVTIALSSSRPDEGTVAPSSVTFTPDNWNALQEVTVTGQNDDVADGPQPYLVVTGAASSSDSDYDTLVVPDVGVTNIDDETAGFQLSRTSGLLTNEAGSVSASFTIRLTSEPTDDVTIPVSVSDDTEGSLSTASLEFTPGNWSDAQTVTLTGVDDDIADGDQPYTVVFGAAVSADDSYDGLVAPSVSATNLDNETAGIEVDPTLGLITSEDGTTAQFSVVLSSQPTASVRIDLTVNTEEGELDETVLLFNASNWDDPQIVTVTGVDDAIVDGNQQHFITGDPSGSADADYAGLSVFQVEVTNVDND